MKRNIIFIFLFFTSVSFIFADLKEGIYKLNGSNIQIYIFQRFGSNLFIKFDGSKVFNGEGQYRYSGNSRIIITFPENTSLGNMSGMEYTYNIINSEAFRNNSQTWELTKDYSNALLIQILMDEMREQLEIPEGESSIL
jgi:hypothetical protein